MPETPPTTSANEANPAVYNPLVMRVVYPVWVHWIGHRFAWGLSNRWLRRSYRTLPGAIHLTVGPGNGGFLRHLPKRVRILHLLDLNPACLRMGARAVRRRDITVRPHVQDVLAAWKDLADGSVDSVDAVMVAHCLRGAAFADKKVLVTEAHRVLKREGVFFGTTIVASGTGVRVNAFARRLLDLYNGARNTFTNAGDTSDGVQETLAEVFGADVEFGVQGCTAVWTAVKR